jgi:hypothetical protein
MAATYGPLDVAVHPGRTPSAWTQLEHGGAWAGFVTAFRISKDRRTSLAISCNTNDQRQQEVVMANVLGQLWM